MQSRNNKAMNSKVRMEMLDENYDLFLSGKITSYEFSNYVWTHLIEGNGSEISNNCLCCNSSK